MGRGRGGRCTRRGVGQIGGLGRGKKGHSAIVHAPHPHPLLHHNPHPPARPPACYARALTRVPRPRVLPARPHIVIVESTYGTSTHLAREQRERRFLDLIASTVKRGGKVLLPIVALGRAQVGGGWLAWRPGGRGGAGMWFGSAAALRQLPPGWGLGESGSTARVLFPQPPTHSRHHPF